MTLRIIVPKNFLSGTINWDEPLPEELYKDFEHWCASLAEFEKLHISVKMPAAVLEKKHSMVGKSAGLT